MNGVILKVRSFVRNNHPYPPGRSMPLNILQNLILYFLFHPFTSGTVRLPMSLPMYLSPLCSTSLHDIPSVPVRNSVDPLWHTADTTVTPPPPSPIFTLVLLSLVLYCVSACFVFVAVVADPPIRPPPPPSPISSRWLCCPRFYIVYRRVVVVAVVADTPISTLPPPPSPLFTLVLLSPVLYCVSAWFVVVVVADTSMTNFFAFLLGSATSLPAVEYFCIYAGLAILFDFFLQAKSLLTRCTTA